ncbi:hypothetical protein, partial [Streptomyces acidiscabies]|uniref:hypothetical protein n=1 Tax=Streptomyces acidiscabies TaxID=42234 RepID=UPI0038F66FB1
QNDYILPDNLVTIGATHQSEKRSEFSFGSGYDQPRKTMAGYIQDQAQFGSFSAQVAGRVEHDSQFGQHETGNLQLGEAI